MPIFLTKVADLKMRVHAMHALVNVYTNSIVDFACQVYESSEYNILCCWNINNCYTMLGGGKFLSIFYMRELNFL